MRQHAVLPGIVVALNAGLVVEAGVGESETGSSGVARFELHRDHGFHSLRALCPVTPGQLDEPISLEGDEPTAAGRVASWSVSARVCGK